MYASCFISIWSLHFLLSSSVGWCMVLRSDSLQDALEQTPICKGFSILDFCFSEIDKICTSSPKLNLLSFFIQRNKVDQCINSLDTVSDECKDLLRQMLVGDPTKVSTLSDAWYSKCILCFWERTIMSRNFGFFI